MTDKHKQEFVLVKAVGRMYVWLAEDWDNNAQLNIDLKRELMGRGDYEPLRTLAEIHNQQENANA